MQHSKGGCEAGSRAGQSGCALRPAQVSLQSLRPPQPLPLLTALGQPGGSTGATEVLVLCSPGWRGWGEPSAGANAGSSPWAGLCNKSGSTGSRNPERDEASPSPREDVESPWHQTLGPLKRNKTRGQPPAPCSAAAAPTAAPRPRATHGTAAAAARSGCCRAALLPPAARQRCRRQHPRCRLAQAQPPPRACRGGGRRQRPHTPRREGLCAPRGSAQLAQAAAAPAPSPPNAACFLAPRSQAGRGGGHGPLPARPWVPWWLLAALCH